MEPHYEKSLEDWEWVQVLAKFVNNQYGATYYQQCGYNSTCMLGETHAVDGEADSGRSWLCMTCTQLGYFQTAPQSGLTSRPRALTAERFLKQCQYVFPGLPLISDASISDFNRRFGAGLLRNVTRVFELDFSDDQWKMVS